MADLLLAAATQRSTGSLNAGGERNSMTPNTLEAEFPQTPPQSRRSEGLADLVGDELPEIDRIVLYIDDLDRCPPTRVVEVLEAVHLLLAGRLFVVVVAVDPRWLLRSIAAHYAELFQGEHLPAAETWIDGPAQYLEKIFQIVLTLPPLEEGGYRRLIDSLVGVRQDQLSNLTEAASVGAGCPEPTSAASWTAARRCSPTPTAPLWSPTG